jgi:hypothetical protein
MAAKSVAIVAPGMAGVRDARELTKDQWHPGAQTGGWAGNETDNSQGARGALVAASVGFVGAAPTHF